MVRGIVIPAVAAAPLQQREFEGLRDYQAAVGGFIEPISIAEPQLTLYVNEDGKSRRMSFNERATALWWLLAPGARGIDLIAGDVVLMAEECEDSRDLLELLQSARRFCVEVQVPDAPGEWIRGPREFASWFDAAVFAVVLESKFVFIEAIRVAAT